MAELATPPSTGTHSSGRVYQCSVCSRCFVKNEHLTRHIRSHTKEKPYKCGTCGHRYTRHDILVRHQRNVKCKAIDPKDDANSLTACELRNQESEEGASAGTTSNAIAPATGDGRKGRIPTIYNMSPMDVLSDAHQLQFNPDVEPAVIPSQLDIQAPAGLAHETTSFSTNDTPPFDTLDFNDSSQWWNVDSSLHDEMWGLDLFSLDRGPSNVEQIQMPTCDNECEQIKRIRRLWFTQIPETPPDALYPERQLVDISGDATAPGSPSHENTDIDDSYRQKLQKRLQILSDEPTVPSVDLLNICIRLYFIKVHPIFPIIHAPTFRPSRKNRSLLIALCALGSLYSGSSQGLQQGIHLFERIHKSTLLNWEQLIAKSHDTMISIIQSAILSQIFGLLSGVPNLLLTVDAFHGPPLAWARQLGLDKALSPNPLHSSADGPALEESWQTWARNEELVRIPHALYIIDVEIATILHHEPIQNFDSYEFTFCSSSRAFMAQSARSWKEIYISDMQERDGNMPETGTRSLRCPQHGLCRVPAASAFTAYAVLEGLSMEILMSRRKSSASLQTKDYESFLSRFQSRFRANLTQLPHDHFQLRILFHGVHMTVHADFDLLEKSVGRDGVPITQDEHERVATWANSSEAQKCMVHAVLISKYSHAHGNASELAIHTPRVLFWAGIAISCFLRLAKPVSFQDLFGTGEIIDDESLITEGENLALFSELRQSGVSDRLSLKMTLCTLTDILQRCGHWEIARKHATILSAVTDYLT